MSDRYQLAMTSEAVSAYVSQVFPQSDQYNLRVTQLEPGSIAVAMPIDEQHLRPGGTVSGPAMFAVADCAAYLLTLAHVGEVALAVTTNLNINFLSKPPAEGEILAEGTLLKLGKRLAVCEIAIRSSATTDLVAHATATYSIPPNR